MTDNREFIAKKLLIIVGVDKDGVHCHDDCKYLCCGWDHHCDDEYCMLFTADIKFDWPRDSADNCFKRCNRCLKAFGDIE